MKIHKVLLLLISTVFLLFSCGSNDKLLPKDVKGLKNILREKQKKIKEIEKNIVIIQHKIDSIEPSKPKSRTKITLDTLRKSNFERFISILASVEPDQVVAASSEVSGRIIKIYRKEGQYIQRGSKVAKIDMEQVDKQIDEIKTQLDLANDIFTRQKRLWDQKIGSEIQYLQAKNNVDKLKNILATINFQKSKSIVLAPISGVIDMEILKEGELAIPGMPIVKIMNDSKIKVVVEIPEKYLKSIKKGDYLDIAFSAINENRRGRVSMIGRSINPINRTFKVEIALKNSDKVLKPNLSGEVLLNDFTQEEALVISNELIQQEVSGKYYVMTATQDSELGFVAKKNYVEIGKTYNGKSIITKGLREGAQIIAIGGLGMIDSQPIEL